MVDLDREIMNLNEAIIIVDKYLKSLSIIHTINLDKIKENQKEFIKEAQNIIKQNPDLLLPERFYVGITGLSEDMEEYIYEQHEFYQQNKTKFYTSFYETVVDMMFHGIDLSCKQLAIIERDYNLIKEKRIKEEKDKNVK